MKKLIFLSLFCFYFTHIFSQFTSIPDSNFEQKLINLGIDSDATVNGQILTADIIGITDLDVTNSSITNLSGIENFGSLEELRCGSNSLSTLDISNNLNLETLWCSANLLTSLNTTSNINLREINCANNQLTSLNVTSNIDLKYLFCENNQLTSLNTNNLDSLDLLYCDGNQLTNIDVSTNISLTALTCDSNQLTSLDLSQNSILGGLSCNNNQLRILDLHNNPNIHVIYCMENQLEYIYLNNPSFIPPIGSISAFDCSNNTPYLSICGNFPNPVPNDWVKDPSASYNYNGCFPRALQGNVYKDDNLNCIKDNGELGYPLGFVKVYNSVDTFYYNTDSLGNYYTALDTGTYQVELVPANNLWTVCTTPQTLTIDTNYNTQIVNLGAQVALSCELLRVDISAPFLRATGNSSAYTVNYCNDGTAMATNAYIEVNIDPSLNVTGTSLPIASQNGNTYTFNLGIIDIFECGSFTINTTVDTSALLGQTHCSEAHIYPDSICGINWAGPDFVLEDSCSVDTIYFEVNNVGGDMSGNLLYYVFEDDLMIIQDPFFLLTGETLNVSVPATQGKTYRFKTDPIPSYPSLLGDGFVTKALESCNPLPGQIIQTSYVLSQYNGNSTPAIGLDCQQNVFAYDPNDKAAQPEGYGATHYIEKNTPLDYRIRFQNTGNDTAFTVVLKDTLSTHLDLSTLQMGVSSHPYTWALNGQELTIRFDNIMLPDSNVNEPASNGFVKYTIDQLPNLPLETRIENTARIYFDFNPAIVTNTTFHTIGENFYSIQLINFSVTEQALATNEYRIFPNPTQDLITVRQSEYGRFNLQLFNLNGQLLQVYNDLEGQYQFNLNNHPAGTYILKVQDEYQTQTYKVIKY
ncbi:MAG: T9SS type A sorting domain-containing protein [Saprospiraceae bacterium]|nr:T9SS type A sorting domain-containing protein [Saprospiraceae bacterium]